MDTTQIIVAVCGFAISVAVALIVYVWIDTKGFIKQAVSEKTCTERMGRENEYREKLCDKLRDHQHNENGSVRINL
jgi:hypothetical protein